MATAVDSALAECAAARTALGPQVEGLVHFLEQGDLKPESREELQQAYEAFTRRQALLKNVVDALQALNADGYPIVPPIDVAESVLHDLEENKNAVNAAFALLRSNAATGLGLRVGQPEPK